MWCPSPYSLDLSYRPANNVEPRIPRYGLIPELFDQISDDESTVESDSGRRNGRATAAEAAALQQRCHDNLVAEREDEQMLSHFGIDLSLLENREKCAVRNKLQASTSAPSGPSSDAPICEQPVESAHAEDESQPSVFLRLRERINELAENYHRQMAQFAAREAAGSSSSSEELAGDQEQSDNEEKEEVNHRTAEEEKRLDEQKELLRRHEAELNLRDKILEQRLESVRVKEKIVEEKEALVRKKEEEAEAVAKAIVKRTEAEAAQARVKLARQPKQRPSVASPDDELIKKELEARQEWKRYLDGEYQALKDDTSPKITKFRIDSKKSINLAINQLASTSSQIECVATKLMLLLHPHNNCARAFPYLVTTVINALLDNVEVILSSNPKSVWSYGILLSRLCDQIPGFQQQADKAIKYACVYCIPAYISKTSKMTEAEFSALRGQRPGETELEFFQRMSSYLRLWLVHVICRQDLATLWLWWSRFVSAKPKRISPFLIAVGLEVSAFFGCYFYLKQFPKLLNTVVIPTYMPKLKALHDEDAHGVLAASITQANILIEEFRTSGQFPLPDGFEMKASESSISISL